MDDSLGQMGEYRLVRLIARGGMGEVFLAQHKGPAGFVRTCVIKRIREEWAEDPLAVHLLLREARLAACLDHDNVVPILRLGEVDGSYFLEMPYVHGKTLRALINRLLESGRQVPPAIAAHLCAQVLHGLHHAHTLTDRKGSAMHIVHRDVSPDNVLVSFSGAVKVTDFGIAKAVGISRTRTSQLRGKLHYMAPERLSAADDDFHCDIYSAGVMLYELLTGRLPFDGDSEANLMYAILHSPFVPPREWNPDIPAALSDIAVKAMAGRPEGRFASALEMAQALEACISQDEPVDVAGFVRDVVGEEEALPPPVPTVEMSTPLSGATVTLPDVSELPAHFLSNPPAVTVRKKRPKRGKFVSASLAGAVCVLVAPLVLMHWPVPQAPERSAPPAAAAASVALPVQSLTAAMPTTEAPPPETEVDEGTVIPVSISPEQEGEVTATASVVVSPAPPKPEKGPAKPKPAVAREAPVTPELEEIPESLLAEVSAAAEPEPAAPTDFGRVVFRINPWAEVFYEGKSLGTTPLSPLRLASGEHRLLLKNSELGTEREVAVRVPPNGEVVLKVNLKPETPQLSERVNSDRP